MYEPFKRPQMVEQFKIHFGIVPFTEHSTRMECQHLALFLFQEVHDRCATRSVKFFKQNDSQACIGFNIRLGLGRCECKKISDELFRLEFFETGRIEPVLWITTGVEGAIEVRWLRRKSWFFSRKVKLKKKLKKILMKVIKKDLRPHLKKAKIAVMVA